jgi:hypothetical protein
MSETSTHHSLFDAGDTPPSKVVTDRSWPEVKLESSVDPDTSTQASSGFVMML